METRTLDIDLIDINARMRDVDESKVAALAESIKTLGLLNPILVHCPDDQTLNLIAGAHRLRAVQRLGWTSIACALMDGDELHAQLAEIDENLMRSELTATQQAEHLQRRKEIWEAMQEAEDAGGSTCATGRNPDGTFGDGQQGFAAATESATGTSKATTNRATRRAREVCQAARDLIRGTKLDTGAYLDRLVKQGRSDAEQVEYVQASLDALRDDERAKELAEERKERERVAKERKQEAKAEACNYLFEKLGARDWSYLIDVIERAGGSLSSDSLRNWEAPVSKVAQ